MIAGVFGGAVLLLLLLVLILGTAPSPTARAAPDGVKMENGYRVVVTLAADTNLEIFEISVKPAGTDGGEKIDTTTQWNEDFTTFAPRSLKSLTESTIKFAYDPKCRGSISAVCNVETTITEHLPNGGTYAYFGYLKGAEFDDMVNGTMPTGTITIVPTNTDPATGDEEEPVYTPPSPPSPPPP